MHCARAGVTKVKDLVLLLIKNNGSSNSESGKGVGQKCQTWEMKEGKSTGLGDLMICQKEERGRNQG